MKNSLEKSKYFPFLAWASIIGFAYVTYTFAQDLEDVATQVAAITSSL